MLKIDVHGKELHRLNKLISDSLECTDTHPEYKPHLTISYVKKDSVNHLLNDTTFEDMSFEINGIDFSSQDDKVTSIKIG